MDSLTHIVLGATVGELVAGRRMGKRAMLLGAVSQSIPDIDILAFLWSTPTEDLLAHRGFTHSILFVLLAAIFLSLAARRWLPAFDMSFKRGAFFFGLQLAIHDFLDAFNAYGTGWFEPFNHSRISFNTLFVADPFFTIGLTVACGALLIMTSHNKRRTTWAWTGLIASMTYLGYAVSNKVSIENEVKTWLNSDKIPFSRLLTTPTPLNSWLWWIVAESKDGYYVGFRSTFDKLESVNLYYFPRNDSLLEPIDGHEEVQHLRRFSQGYYTVESRGDTLVFNDLRFGQNGWDNPEERFVFNYYVSHPYENQMVIQRGRVAKLNQKTLESFISRIKGN